MYFLCRIFDNLYSMKCNRHIKLKSSQTRITFVEIMNATISILSRLN